MALPQRPTIALLEEEPEAAEAARNALKGHGFAPVAFTEAAAFRDGLELRAFDALLVDSGAGGLDVLGLPRRLAERGLALPVVVLARTVDVGYAVRVVRGGAVDVVPKPIEDEVLAEAVTRAVSLCERWRRNLAEREVVRERMARLTPRELEAWDLLGQGYANREVAAAMGIHANTLDIYRLRIKDKMGVRTLAAFGRARLLIRTEPLGLAYLGL